MRFSDLVKDKEAFVAFTISAGDGDKFEDLEYTCLERKEKLVSSVNGEYVCEEAFSLQKDSREPYLFIMRYKWNSWDDERKILEIKPAKRVVNYYIDWEVEK